MPLIPESVIDEIQHRADIAEFIGRYVALKRAGRHFKAACPFHKERTPSFMVNTEKQIFHCFGCGVGGNIFSFLMQHDRITFPEAVRQLADHVGVAIPEPGESAAGRPAARLLALMEQIAGYFERMLQEPRAGASARDYLARRGVPEAARQAFRLGLAPDGWDHLLHAAAKTGVRAGELEAAGLIIQGAATPYDRFRSRLMFPIQDSRGRIVGFGGRSLDGHEPKYLNSPETALYTKGRHLFGLAQAKEAIVRTRTAVVVEGYFDCVVLAASGIAQVVSPLGTALTEEQTKLLKRYAETVILAFDADAAGEQATLKGIDRLVDAGLEIRVAQLPQGVDPDEVVRTQGRERMERLLGESVTLMDALMRAACARHPARDIESRVKAARFVLPTVARVPDAMLRREYVRRLAERLELDEAAVSEELGKAVPRGSAAADADTHRARAQEAGQAASQAWGFGSGAAARSTGAERLFTALVLDDPSRAMRADVGVSTEDVQDPVLRRLLALVMAPGDAGRPATAAQVISRVSEEGHGSVVASLVELAQSLSSKEEAFEDCLRRLRAEAKRRHLSWLRARIRSAQEEASQPTLQRLLQEYQHELATMHRGGAPR